MRTVVARWRAFLRLGIPFVAGALALGSLSCLKGDNRPVPGNVTVTVEASDATRQGFTTTDGWTVTIDRLVAAVGDLGLNGYPDAKSSTCNEYSQSSYDRIFDFTKVTSPQKVGIVFGLGKCFVEYRLRAPSDNSLVEVGATNADVTLMRTQASDAYVMDSRITLRLVGHASSGGATLRFDWAFRKSLRVTRCSDRADVGFVDVVSLQANLVADLHAIVSGEELFRATPDDDSPLVFDRVAQADANGDGVVTLDELASVPVPPLNDPGLGGAGGANPNPVPLPQSLEDLVYEWLYPRVTRVLGGGPCVPEAR